MIKKIIKKIIEIVQMDQFVFIIFTKIVIFLMMIFIIIIAVIKKKNLMVELYELVYAGNMSKYLLFS